jgi:DNA replication and repair protein RecF
MLAYARLIKERRHCPPLFLLDDIAAHLDVRRRAALFDEIRALGAQALLTGTDDEDFADLIPFAQLFHIDNGAASPA